jgi:hypothetical protein
MYSSQKPSSGFPNPLADALEKQSKKYGLRYAKAIEGQWGKMSDKNSMHGSRNGTFKRNRTYANGTQDTSIYKQLLTSLNPNGGEGSLLNLEIKYCLEIRIQILRRLILCLHLKKTNRSKE